jgi:hypothetical protein
MTQEQRQVKIFFLVDGQELASATGNNASWLCPCGYKMPLIGRSGNTLVKCPDCSRKYLVVPEDNIPLQRVLCVKEMQ